MVEEAPLKRRKREKTDCRGIPIDVIVVPKRIMEILKDFEKTTERFIV